MKQLWLPYPRRFERGERLSFVRGCLSYRWQPSHSIATLTRPDLSHKQTYATLERLCDRGEAETRTQEHTAYYRLNLQVPRPLHATECPHCCKMGLLATDSTIRSILATCQLCGWTGGIE